MLDLISITLIVIYFVLNPFLIDFFFSFIPQHLILVYFYVKFGPCSFEYHLFCFGFFFLLKFSFSISSLNILLIKIYLHDFILFSLYWVILI